MTPSDYTTADFIVLAIVAIVATVVCVASYVSAMRTEERNRLIYDRLHCPLCETLTTTDGCFNGSCEMFMGEEVWEERSATPRVSG